MPILAFFSDLVKRCVVVHHKGNNLYMFLMEFFLKNPHIRGVAVDIDDTLSATVSYWAEMLIERFGAPEGLNAQETIQKYRYTQRVPAWQTPEAFAWMDAQRHSNELQTKFVPIEGAQEWVGKLHAVVPVVAYLTTRPESVTEGTQQWLTKYGFPNAPIVSRPKSIPLEEGNSWKAELLNKHFPAITGIIDDHPGVVEALPEGYQGTAYLLGYDGPPRPGMDVVNCKTWEEIYNAVFNRSGKSIG